MSTTVETILLYTIAAGFLSIVYGFFTGKNILNQSAGNSKMQDIASAIDNTSLDGGVLYSIVGAGVAAQRLEDGTWVGSLSTFSMIVKFSDP